MFYSYVNTCGEDDSHPIQSQPPMQETGVRAPYTQKLQPGTYSASSQNPSHPAKARKEATNLCGAVKVEMDRRRSR